MNPSHKTSSLYVFLLFILLSCNNITESKNTLLNSERIEQKFGSYGIDIVQSDNQSRVSFLYSLEPNNKNKKNYHTLAIVKFKETRQVSNIHEKILNGGSIGKSFKKEGWEIDKTNHQMMELEEGMIVYIIESVLSNNRKELEILGRDISVLENIKAPFEKMTYEEVLGKLNSMGFDLSWGDDFGYKEEKALTQDLKSPMYITNFPREKGFYHRPDPSVPRSLVCHDLLAPEGYGEIIGGGERVWSSDELIERIREEGLEPDSYGWYLDIRKFGSVPHSGFGLGIDRTVSWICGSDHIKHVIPFPRTMRRTTP